MQLPSFSSLIRRLEEEPLSHILFAFFFFIVLRFFLEAFLTGLGFEWDDLIHFYLFYVVMALSMTLVASLITKESYVKVLKFVLTLFSVILLVPIADFLLSGGSGLYVGYKAWIGLKEFIVSFVTLGGVFRGRGITPGIRIELGTILILAFYYFSEKTHQYLKSALSAVLVYTVLAFYAILPSLVSYLLSFTDYSYVYSSKLMIGAYLIFLFPLVILSIFIWDKKTVKALFNLLRPYRLVHYLLIFLLGMSVESSLGQVNLTRFYFLLVAIASSKVFLTITNDVADYEIDRLSGRSNPLLDSTVSSPLYKKIGFAALLLAASYSLAVGLKSLVILLSGIGLYYFYSTGPLRLKRIPMVSKLVIGAVSVLLAFLGFNFAGGGLYNFPLSYAIGLFFTVGLAANFIDIKDYAGDKGRIKTLPALLGLKTSKKLIGILFLLSLSLVPVFFQLEFLTPLAVVLGLLELWAVNRKGDKYDERLVFLFYFPLLLLLIYFL